MLCKLKTPSKNEQLTEKKDTLSTSSYRNTMLKITENRLFEDESLGQENWTQGRSRNQLNSDES